MSKVQNHNNFHHTTISRTYNSIAKQREAKQIPSQAKPIQSTKYSTQGSFSSKLPKGNHLAWITTTKPTALTILILS